MLIVLIVVPCIVLGVAVVTLVDRAGLLPRMPDGGGGWWASSGSGGLADGVPRSGLVAAIVVMGLWILAWLVALVIGLSILSA
jgi:hypothetical protein